MTYEDSKLYLASLDYLNISSRANLDRNVLANRFRLSDYARMRLSEVLADRMLPNQYLQWLAN